jgi:hypothetical protein
MPKKVPLMKGVPAHNKPGPNPPGTTPMKPSKKTTKKALKV